MNKPIVIECFSQDGSHSHWNMVNPGTGEILASDKYEIESLIENIHQRIEWVCEDARHKAPEQYFELFPHWISHILCGIVRL